MLEEVGIVWRRRSYGADMGSFLPKERLTHVAFADDCTFEARSWLSLKRMILQRSIAEKRSEPSSFQMPGPEESHELDSARERAACRRLHGRPWATMVKDLMQGGKLPWKIPDVTEMPTGASLLQILRKRTTRAATVNLIGWS